MFPPFSMTPLFAFVARSIFVIYFLFVSSCDCSLKRFIVIFFLICVLWQIICLRSLDNPERTETQLPVSIFLPFFGVY